MPKPPLSEKTDFGQLVGLSELLAVLALCSLNCRFALGGFKFMVCGSAPRDVALVSWRAL
jgi:hypothetical protein